MLKGKTDGTFTVSQNDVRAGDTPSALALADVDVDGLLDAVVTNFLGGDASLLVGPDLTPWPPLEVGAHPAAVAVADLNSDGKPDVLTANQVSNTLGVLLNQGSSFMQQVTYPLRSAPLGIVVGDLNGDGAGKLDAAVALPSLNVVRVLWGQGAGAFSDAQSVDLKVGQSPGALVLAKLNGDDLWDLIVTNRGDGTVSVLLGQAGGQFASAVAYATSTDPAGVAVGDVTGDGKPDVVVANKGSASVTLLEGQGDGTLKPLGSLVVQASPESIAIADLDNDGLGDIVVANEDAGSISLLYGKK